MAVDDGSHREPQAHEYQQPERIVQNHIEQKIRIGLKEPKGRIRQRHQRNGPIDEEFERSVLNQRLRLGKDHGQVQEEREAQGQEHQEVQRDRLSQSHRLKIGRRDERQGTKRLNRKNRETSFPGRLLKTA